MKLDENSSLSKVRDRIDATRGERYLMAWEKWREIGEIVIEDLKKRGQFFNTRQGLFFFDAECRRAFPLYKDVDFAASINRRYGINPKEHGFERVLADLQTEAVLNGRKTEVRRFTHYDRKSKRLYVSRFAIQLIHVPIKSRHVEALAFTVIMSKSPNFCFSTIKRRF